MAVTAATVFLGLDILSRMQKNKNKDVIGEILPKKKTKHNKTATSIESSRSERCGVGVTAG